MIDHPDTSSPLPAALPRSPSSCPGRCPSLIGAALLLALTTAISPLHATDPLTAAQLEAQAAYERGDMVGFLAGSQRAVELLPDHPRLVYNLACAQARSGQADAAMATLGRLATMGVSLPIADDEDLASLRGRADFTHLAGHLSALGREPVGAADAALHLGLERDFVPESVVQDPKRRSLIVGSVRQRRIARLDAERNLDELVSAGRDGLMAVLGMTVDAPRDRLWACSSGMREMARHAEGELGKAAVFGFDLATGALAARIDLPADRERVCNDLALLADGRLLVSDAQAGEIWVVDPTAGTPALLVPAGTFRSPQAIVPSPDGRHAHVADWSRGLFQLDIAAGTARRLPAPSGSTLIGIDGMVRHGNTLYAVQNALRPNRVVALDLAANGIDVAALRVLLANHPAFDEPTLLTILPGDGTAVDPPRLLVVANSHWNRFDRDGNLPHPIHLSPPILLGLALPTP